jgi:SAM-dependent methyltransferase
MNSSRLHRRPALLGAQETLDTVSKWPKRPTPLTREQVTANDDFMKLWHEILPRRYGMIERFNHSFPVQHSRAGFHRSIEVGAGLGEHLTHESLSPEQESSYSVVEMRTNMAERLRARHPHISVIVGDCQGRLPFPDGHFDRYLAIHVFEHLPNLPACIRQAWRLLDKERGQLLVVIPCEGGLAYSLARRASAQRIFERKFGMPYRPIIEHEHINQPHEILTELEPYFTLEAKRFFPLRPLPIVSANLCLGLALRPRQTPRAQYE